ncbi:sugar transferase [Enterococcus italicus]|uniref:sugar transferase n=1 Tax=Enterococcus italicus TaxID=246144 RepID=UPI003F47D255
MEKESYVADDPFVKSLKKKETIVLINQELLKRKRATFAFKRIVDLVGGAIGLVVATPIMLGVAIAMKKEEPNGPIIFSQTRVGKNGKTFRMYKIRSMCLDAENKLEELLAKNEVQGAMFKMKDDPRVTKVGKFIRKASIDELPQLWNVVKGEMSLVGPRPPLPREFKTYSSYDKQRLLVKPGCTGLWQVSGRNDVHFKDMVALDVEYIQTMSIANELKIIFKTIWIMIRPNGAY